MGRGFADAEIVSYPRVCESCHMQMVFAKRTVVASTPSSSPCPGGEQKTKTFPIHKDLKTGEWRSHTAFCPVNGMIVKAGEKKVSEEND